MCQYFFSKLNKSAAPKAYVHCQMLTQFPFPTGKVRPVINWVRDTHLIGNYKRNTEQTLQQHWVKRVALSEPYNDYRECPAACIVFLCPFPKAWALCSRQGAEYQCTAQRMDPGFAGWSQKTQASALQVPVAWSIPPVSPGGCPSGAALAEGEKKAAQSKSSVRPLLLGTTGWEHCPQHSYLRRILGKIKVGFLWSWLAVNMYLQASRSKG